MSTWMVEWTCRWPMPGHWRAGCTCIKAGTDACTDARRSLVSIFEAGLGKPHFFTKKSQTRSKPRSIAAGTRQWPRRRGVRAFSAFSGFSWGHRGPDRVQEAMRQIVPSISG